MILVCGGIKGGVGKSTLAANLAVLAASLGSSVALIDADTQATSMTWAAARAANQRARYDVTTAAILGRQIRAELPRLASRYDHVVVDAGARDTDGQRAALLVADMVVLPFPPRGPDLWTLEAVAHMLDSVRQDNPGLRALALVNKADAQGQDNAEAEAAFAEYGASLERAPVRIGTRKAIAVAHLMGLGVSEAQRRDPSADQELTTLARYCFSAQ